MCTLAQRNKVDKVISVTKIRIHFRQIIFTPMGTIKKYSIFLFHKNNLTGDIISKLDIIKMKYISSIRHESQDEYLLGNKLFL